MQWRPSFRLAATLAIWVAPLIFPQAQAQQGKPAKQQLKPDLENVKYGPHERNILDLWKARSDTPTPLVVFIHGGGFQAGDKSNISQMLLSKCLNSGMSMAAINYRLTQQAPFPAAFLDSARAIQFLRYKAKDWNIDATRIAATGGSAGAGTSLWIGFHDNMADPKSDDPVLRQSTRLTCMAVLGAQSSYDPRFIKKVVGGRAHEHPALRPFYALKPDELDSPRAYKMYEEASPINYVTADDPPVFLFYNEPKGPLPPDAKPGQGIHHPNFGVALKEKMDELKIECVLRHSDDYKGKGNGQELLNEEMVEFFQKHFAQKRAQNKAALQKPESRPRQAGRPGEIITPPARGERQADKLKVGDSAPDFTLPDLAGSKQITLPSFRGKKPVVLIFGSYT